MQYIFGILLSKLITALTKYRRQSGIPLVIASGKYISKCILEFENTGIIHKCYTLFR